MQGGAAAARDAGHARPGELGRGGSGAVRHRAPRGPLSGVAGVARSAGRHALRHLGGAEPMKARPSMHLGVIVMLALRNLRRNLRRTILTATAFIIGGALLTFAQTFGDGTHEQWIDSGVRTGSGHVTVEVPGFRVSRKIEDRLPGWHAAARPGGGRLVRGRRSGHRRLLPADHQRAGHLGVRRPPRAGPGRRSHDRGVAEPPRRAGRRGALPEEGRPARGLRGSRARRRPLDLRLGSRAGE